VPRYELLNEHFEKLSAGRRYASRISVCEAEKIQQQVQTRCALKERDRDIEGYPPRTTIKRTSIRMRSKLYISTANDITSGGE
jgi:hypothetical protein